MPRKVITYIGYPALIVGLVLCLVGVAYAAGNIDSTYKYAWGTNVGWINFNPTDGGVAVYPDHLEGYAWGENVGWIRLGTYTAGGSHTYGNTSASDYGVNNSSGTLSSYAWGTNVGWIKFDPTGGGVTINTSTGKFDGYAWGENVGWIHFQNASPEYYVQTSYHPTVVTLGRFVARPTRGVGDLVLPAVLLALGAMSWTLVRRTWQQG
jgi:hypothetical protein